MELKIKELKTDARNDPKYSYLTNRYVQTLFLKEKCKANNIACRVINKEVQIFSKKKLDQFKTIVKDSYSYDEIQAPEFMEGATTFMDGKTLLCVYIKEKDTCYITEQHFGDWMLYVYQKKVPKAKNYKIFNSKRELTKFLLEQEKVII